jgi:hypothetical protein
MTNTTSALLTLVILGILILSRSLGIAKRSFRESLTDSLDAIYVRQGVLSWELLVAAKGKEVGIKQGVSILPFAKAKAAQIAAGKLPLL